MQFSQLLNMTFICSICMPSVTSGSFFPQEFCKIRYAFQKRELKSILHQVNLLEPYEAWGEMTEGQTTVY